MSNPYRENASPSCKNLPRRRAFVRGLIRRIVLPTMLTSLIGGGFLFANFISYNACSDNYKNADAKIKRHFQDWQSNIDVRQSKLDKDTADADKRLHEIEAHEAELNRRVKNFQDIVSMSPMLIKGDSERVDAALRKSDVIK